jgi:hypothetical protein
VKRPSKKKQTLQVTRPKDLLKVPGKKALEVILESPTPVTLVQSLAQEDLFWLVQEIGPEDALPILSLASNDQWQYLLDLELWTRDRLQMGSVNRWLGLLLKADTERFLIWGLREHIELIELHLSRHIDVRIREHDESPSDIEEGYFTLDGVFYIRIKHAKYEQTIRDLLTNLMHHDLHRFRQVLLELSGILPGEIEENMYRLRNVRLAEKGFLPFEEAIGIYQYLNPRSLFEQEPRFPKVMQQQPTDYPVPVSTSLLIEDQDLFHLSLQNIEDMNFLEKLQREFAAMCNQIISADFLVVRDKERLAGVVRKACGYLSIGLDKVAGGDLQQAARLLHDFPLAEIFRVGYGTALELRWETEKWLRESWFGKQAFDLSFWGDDWARMLEGVLKKRPLFCKGLSEGEAYREFRTLHEITHCHKALDEVIALDHLFSLLFPKSPVAFLVQAYQPITYKSLLLTCWARHHLKLAEDVEPLAFEDLKAFFRDLWDKKTGPRQVDPGMKQAFLDWLQMRSGRGVDEILSTAGNTFNIVFGELDQEYGSVSLKDLDPRYVKHFLVTL